MVRKIDRKKIKVLQIVSCILIIIGGSYNQIFFWNYKYMDGKALYGLIYNGALIIYSLVLVYCIDKFDSKLFLFINRILLIGMIIRLIEVAWDVILGEEVPAYSIFLVGIPYVSVIAVATSVILKKNTISRKLAVVNAIIWGIGGIYGIVMFVESIYWGVEDTLSYAWMLGCCGTYYSLARMLFIHKDLLQGDCETR